MNSNSAIHRLLSHGPLAESYGGKMVLVAGIGIALPVLTAIASAWLGLTVTQLILATAVAGVLGLLMCWMGIRSLLRPIDETTHAMEAFAKTREVPDLDVPGRDLAARLAVAARKGMVVLHEAKRRRDFDHTTDPLTGLINQRSAIRRLGSDILRATRDQRPMCVGLVEIDNMEALARQFGHDSAGVIVKTVSKVIVEALRRSDWVASYGNNEFLVGLWGVDQAEARTAFERVNDTLSNNSRYPVAVSVGVARAEKDENPDSVIANATNAMYEARKSGGRCIVFSAGS